MKDARVVLSLEVFVGFGKNAIGIGIGKDGGTFGTIELFRVVFATLFAKGFAGKGHVPRPGIQDQSLSLWHWTTNVKVDVVGACMGV